MDLSLLSLECVVAHLDADKRLTLSLCYKSFRKLEESVAMKFDKLIITQSDITINDRRYKLGEMLDIGQIEDISEDNRARIEGNNSTGGVEYLNRMDAVLEPGDVKMPWYWDRNFLEAEKYEIMQSVRQVFMSALEKFYESASRYNPLGELLNNGDLDKVFEEIERESGEKKIKSCSVSHMLQEMIAVKLEQDELSILYPKAFKNIVDSIEALKTDDQNPRNGGKADILKKLAYPQMIYPHFNQLTVFNDDSQDYHHRLPDGLSLRQAFKQFSTVLLGNREIHVRDFKLDGEGIIPFPDGFQIERVEYMEGNRTLSGECVEILNAYNSTIKFVDKMSLSVGDGEILRLPLIQKCRLLEISDSESSIPLDTFSVLLNEVVSVNMTSSTSSPIKVIDEWLKNENRKIGSKMIVGVSSSLTTRISEIGFSKTPGRSSYYRPLEGGKKAVLDVAKNKKYLTAHHWNRIPLAFCFCVEIVNA